MVFNADDLVISMGREKSREYAYTNKVAAHFSGETGARPSRSYHGLCVSMHKLLEDWRFQIDGVEITPSKTTQVLAYPHQLVRLFENPQIREQICLLDGQNVLMVDLTARANGEGLLRPYVDLRPVRQVIKPDYRVVWRQKDNLLLIRGGHGTRSFAGGSFWLGVTSNLPLQFSPQGQYYSTVYLRGQRRGVMGRGTPFVPGSLRFQPKRGRARFLFVGGRTQREVATTARRVLASGTEPIRKKKNRMDKLLFRCPVKSEDHRFNSALAWARLSLDALIMNQEGPGIYAGLPWFANYWGRDTGISLPGATWVSGRFALAKKILVALAHHQDRRAGSKTYGRIPNLLEPGEKLYNTADATLWFVRQVEEYLRYSGDVRTARTLFPALRRAIQGELFYRTDQSGLVVHGAAETWMDAGGNKRPFSPRDNRAVEIQVLWHTALLSGAKLALLAGQPSLSVKWTRLSQQVRRAFLRQFWDPVGRCLRDHLDPDGTPDRQIRPNQLLALTIPFRPLLSRDQERAILHLMMNRLVYPHGVGTLVAEDPQFRPRHLSPGRYHFDEAYHNGDVWPWLTGPLVTALVRHGRRETAHALTEILINQILDRGAVGTLGELFNASPTEENDNEAGTFTQAWSLAEFIRVVFQDYLGVRPDVLKNEVVVEPAVPAGWGDVDFEFVASRTVVEARYLFSGGAQIFTFLPQDPPQPLLLHLRVRLPQRMLLVVTRSLRAGRKEEIQVFPHSSGWRVLVNGKIISCHFQRTDFDVGKEEEIAFKRPPLSGERSY